MIGLFKRSIENKEKIVIFYIDKDNKVTQRFVRVIKINDTHFLAYCFYRKRVRTFKLDNILSAGAIKIKKGIA